MPSLDQHSSSLYTKLLYIGDSGTGKTGSLASLVPDYSLRVLDTDNGMEALKNFIIKDCGEEHLARVQYEPCRDKYRPSASGPTIKGTPRAFIHGLKLLERWPDESDPAEWGERVVFVLDSLSTYAIAAFEWAKALNPGARHPQQWYFAAQQALEAFLSMITSNDFHCNVILISHINFTERKDGRIKGYPNSIGQALGPVIGRYFNTFLLAESKGSSRVIQTAATGMIDLKNPAPFRIKAEYPLATGMGEIFKNLKGV